MREARSSRSRTRASAAALAATSLVLAACTGGGDDGGDDGATNGVGAGGALVVGVTSDPDTLFPWKATQFQAIDVLTNLYGTLTELDADLEVVPGLAEEWDVSEDGLTMTFTLREGVTSHDGSELDSDRKS